MSRISPLSLVRNGEVESTAPSIEALRTEVSRQLDRVFGLVETAARAERVRFVDVEEELRTRVLAFAASVVVLFLALREQHVLASLSAARGSFEQGGRRFRRAPANARNLSTLFGVVRYWRTYLREVGAKRPRGMHPLDLSLGLGKERFSFSVLATAARLATQMAFCEARATMGRFVPQVPSTEVIEKTVLGLGAYTEAFFAQQPAPEEDGEVLVIEVDGKAVPTATEQELRRRRRPRSPRAAEQGPRSPRHRGRHKRARHPTPPRRKKGDKGKNGKVATLVVLYTLRRRGTRRLEGPLNRRHYVSFGSKRHAFEVARREADKRGFTRESGKLIQLVSDGDRALAELHAEYFPEALHTLDAYHAFERLWAAGGAFLKEGSPELKRWVQEQKERLFRDEVEALFQELSTRLEAIPKTGPGTKGRRRRLSLAFGYLQRRASMIRYGWLRRRDLVIGTGIVEGAIKHIVGRRCDHGGMRWIKERAQALLQLRCIQINGDWERFERFVHERIDAHAQLHQETARLPRAEPVPLPVAA